MKDPLDKEDTPYDILSIDRNASPEEIHKALGEFLKKGKNIQQGMNAARKLRRVRDRIEVDIFYYVLGEIEISKEPSELNIDVQDFLDVPILEIDDAFTDLNRDDFSEDFKEINFRPLKINDLEKYNDLRECKMEVVFDK